MTTVALGEIVDFYSGGTPSKAKTELWDGDVPWFSAKDMKRPRLTDSADHVSDSVFRTTSLRKLPAGTVAMVVRGMILAHTVPISILDVESAINQDLKALRPRYEIEPSFLAAMLRAQHSTILSQVSTAAHGTKKLDTRVLENIRIPLPSLPEQRRIAAILDQADALSVKRRQVLAGLETLTRAVFHDMVGAGVPTVKIGAALRLRSGAFLSAKQQVPGLYPVYGGNGVNGFHASYMFDDGMVAIGRVGAYCGCVHLTPPRSWITDNALYVSEKLIDFTDEFLAAALTNANLNQFASRSGQPLISAGRVANVSIPAPPLPRQREFSGLIECIGLRQAAVQGALAAEGRLFASLQSRAFRGEL
jgi:type I restriction enzyme, S subunit